MSDPAFRKTGEWQAYEEWVNSEANSMRRAKSLRMAEIRRDLSLALTGFVQVFLVAMNTIYIARGNYPLAFMTSMGISYFWTRNVSRVAVGVERDRWIYALGAASGCFSGMALARWLMG